MCTQDTNIENQLIECVDDFKVIYDDAELCITENGKIIKETKLALEGGEYAFESGGLINLFSS